MAIRGVRGAITVERDDPDAILLATRLLLDQILEDNGLMKVEDIASAFFTLTEDLSSAYPALAARQLGWVSVPMLCAKEIPVPDSLPRVLRVLIHWNTDLLQSEIRHVYLREAMRLRPDLCLVDQDILSGMEEEQP